MCYYGQANTAYFDSVCLVRSNDVYDLKAQTESNTEAEDAESSYTYDENGNILTYTDENGKVYTYTYNEFGDLVSCLTPDGKGDRYTYQLYDSDGDEKNDASLPLTEIYEDGTTVTYTYFDNHEIKTETTVCDSVTTVLTYNTDGQLITEATASGNDSTVTYTYTYDADGNLLTRLTEDGVGDRYTYCSFDLNNDGLNDKTEILTEALEDGSQNSYNYNNKGILIGETRSKNEKSLSYTYDENGNTTSVTHNGFSYNYEYDIFGNTESVKVGSQPLVTYDYQPEGRLSSTTYGNGSKETYTYNAYGLLNSKSQSGLGSFSWRYDALGRLYYLRDNVNSRKTYYYYDNSNRLVGQHIYSTERSNAYDNFLFSADTAYGIDGNISKTSIMAGKKTDKVYYAFNEQGLNTQTKFTNVRKVDFTYGEDGNLTGKTTSTDTPITETFSYYTSGAIENHTINSDTYSYTYSDNGNIREIQKNEAIVQSYEYDDDNQLVRENDAEAGKTVTFTYDNGGNITSKYEYAYTLVPTEELVNPQSTKTYSYDGIWKDKLTNYNGQSITYDNVGNPTNYMGATMTWFGRQMQSYAKDGTSITYQYDENGLRTQKNVNGTEHEYFYSDGLLRYEKKVGEYELFYRYDAKGIPVSIVRTRFSDGKVHKLYVVTNTRGDVIELRNGDGTLNTKYTYDAWGKLISMTDATGAALSQNTFGAQNSLRYRGYVYDRETGLYYLQSRYYDPETGRFINADSVDYLGYSEDTVSCNLFVYCENEPVDIIDRFGNTPDNSNLSTSIALIFSLVLLFSINEAIKDYTYYTGNYSKGKVHIIDAKVEKYVASTMRNVYVVDYRKNKDPDMKIISSYKIKNRKDQSEILEILLEYNKKYPVKPPWKRSKESMLTEWKFHNWAYALNFKRLQTADTDLNNEDEGKGFFDFLGR